MNQATELLQLRALLEVHGADLQRWPVPAAAAARVLLAQSADARAELELFRRVESLLDHDEVPALPSGLRARILSAAPKTERSLAARWADFWAALGGYRVAGPALAAAMVVGLGAGVRLASFEELASDDEDLVALALLATEYPDY